MANLPFELKGKTVYVAGHRGMAGSALVRRLAREGVELLTASRSEADLRDQAAVNAWFAAKRPQSANHDDKRADCDGIDLRYRPGLFRSNAISGWRRWASTPR